MFVELKHVQERQGQMLKITHLTRWVSHFAGLATKGVMSPTVVSTVLTAKVIAIVGVVAVVLVVVVFAMS